GVRSCRRARAAADHRGHTRHQGVVDLLRRDEVDVRVDPARRQQASLAGDDLRARTDLDVDTRLHVGIPGLADAGDPPLLDADVRLDDSTDVEHDRVGDHRVGGDAAAALALAHAVADHLAAAELHLLAVDRVVALDLDHQVGVGQADPVTGGGTVHLRVRVTVDGLHRAPSSGPITSPRNPWTTRAPS